MQHDEHVIAWVVYYLMQTRTPARYRKALSEFDRQLSLGALPQTNNAANPAAHEPANHTKRP